MSEDVAPSIAELHAGKADAKAWFGLAVLALPTLLVAIDMTVLHLAVPAITASIAPSPVEMLWIVDIYGFMIAGLLVTMGTLGDRLGRRRLLMVGSAGFGAASAIAAFAPSPEILIVARALLGFTAATLMPSTLSLISNMFPNEAERGVAIAIWSSMFMGGTAIGPLLGGFLLEHFWWGSVFLLNVPLTILLLIMAPAFLPEFRAARAAPIDMPSIALSLFGILSATYGIKQIASHGYDVVNLTTMLAGAVLLVGFTRRQLHLAVPMLDLSLFRFPTFTAALTVQFLVVFAVGAPYFLSAQYLQLIQDLSPLDAGLAMLPATIAGIAASLVASRLATAMRPAYVISIVLLVGAGGLGVLITLSGNSELWLVIVGLSLAFVGPSAATALTVNLIVSTAPVERAGEASGLSETSGEFGMALGIALTGSLAVAIYRSHIGANLPAGLPPELAMAANQSLGELLGALGSSTHLAGQDVAAVAKTAFVNSMAAAATVGLLLMLLLAAISIVFLRRVPKPQNAEIDRPPR